MLDLACRILAGVYRLSYRGRGIVRTRKAALLLPGLLVLGNLTAAAILVTSLVTSKSSDLSGGELLFIGFAIWCADVLVFGLWFWEVDAGGPPPELARRPVSRATSISRKTTTGRTHRGSGASASVLSSLIPSPGGIGAAEASLTAGLIAVGIDDSTAFAIALTSAFAPSTSAGRGTSH